MFAKLAILCMALFSFSSSAEVGPIRFKDVQVAKAWFSKNYSEHEMKAHIVNVDGKDLEIYAFYGVHGSGFVRVDGWFYECAKKSTCSLFAMANLGLSRNLKNYPDVTYQAPYLLIGSPDANQIKIRLK